MNNASFEQGNANGTRKFITAWSELSAEALLPYFSIGAVYQNMPWSPLEGETAIRGFLDAFFPMAEKVQFDINLLTTKSSLVCTERVDQFCLENGVRMRLPVLGVFEFDQEGKIKAWRDYFDLKSWLDQGGR